MSGKLSGKVALVTGASRGIGRGIALQLGGAGAKVYITGRKPKQDTENNTTSLQKTAQEITERGGDGIALYCDHSVDESVKELFERIKSEEEGRLDILVNNAYSAVNTVLLDAGKNFWEQEPSIWDEVNNVGLRNHYICTVYAARLMVPRRKGLIVTVSSIGGLTYFFNVAYGVGKAACDRLAADTAFELRKANIASVSLWPGPVRTELVQRTILDNQLAAAKLHKVFDDGESTEFAGKAIVHLASDPNLMKQTGRVLVTSDLADKYGFTDIDGHLPESMHSLSRMLKYYKWDRLASWMPRWAKLPWWLVFAGNARESSSIFSVHN